MNEKNRIDLSHCIWGYVDECIKEKKSIDRKEILGFIRDYERQSEIEMNTKNKQAVKEKILKNLYAKSELARKNPAIFYEVIVDTIEETTKQIFNDIEENGGLLIESSLIDKESVFKELKKRWIE